MELPGIENTPIGIAEHKHLFVYMNKKTISKFDKLKRISSFFHRGNEAISLPNRSLHFPDQLGDIGFN